jgi:hypothetical protein
MIDFPASPTVGDIFDTGTYSYEWDGVAWIAVPVGSGGGITDAPIDGVQYGRQDAAWTPVVGGATGDFLPLTGGTLTGPLLVADGAVAAPSVAFSSEPGFGWYRTGAGQIKMSQGGAGIWAMSALAPDTYSTQFAQSVGGRSVFSLANAPVGSVDFNQLNIETQADGNYAIGGNNAGAATNKPLSFNGFAHTYFNGPGVSMTSGGAFDLGMSAATGEASLSWFRGAVKRWYMTLTGEPGDSLAIARCDAAGAYAASPLNIDWATGDMTLIAPILTITGSTGINANGPANFSGTINNSAALAFNSTAAADFGGGTIGATVLAANPAWNVMYLQALHVTGLWAGWRMSTAAAGMGFIDYILSGATPTIDLHGGSVIGNVTGNAGTATTASNSNAVNGISGWAYSNLANNPLYLWATEGDGASQHLTQPGNLSVGYANSAGSAPIDGNYWIHNNGSAVRNIFNNGVTQLHVSLDGAGTSSWPISPASDERIKQNIAPTQVDALAEIRLIEFVEFKYRTDLPWIEYEEDDHPGKLPYEPQSHPDTYAIDDGRLHQIGAIAQQLLTISPELVETEVNTWYAPRQDKLLWRALKAIQQLAEIVDPVQTELNATRTLLNSSVTRVDDLTCKLEAALARITKLEGIP